MGWRGPVAGAIGLAGLAAMISVVDRHDPVTHWLVWRYVVVLGLAAAWSLSCVAGGYWFTGALGLAAVPLRERLLLSLAVGVFSFGFLTAIIGFVGGLGWVTFYLLPLSGALAGGRAVIARVARAQRLLRRLPRTRRWSPAELAASAAGVVLLAGLYLIILTPRNLTYDALWYHQPLAEQFAATGRVFPMASGWFNGVTPHLASWLYAWAYSAPFGTLFDHIELAQHLELFLVVASVAAVGVLVDVLLPRPRAVAAWAGRFLFPGILLYDSAPGGGADHVLAFWAIPLVLTFRRLWRTPTLPTAMVFGLLTGAAVLTKYQAVMLVLGPVSALAIRAAVALLRGERAVVRSGLVAGAIALVASTPHWLANLVWYGNPVYPYFLTMLGGRPTFPGMRTTMSEAAWAPQGTTVEKLRATLEATLTFGFRSHDWAPFHGDRPVFGSLFLIAIALAPFISRSRWVLGIGLLAWAGVPAWYLTQHQDRYLQALAPVMTAVVVTVFLALWRRHALTRPVLAALVAFQLLHTSDLYFLPSHVMAGGSPVTAVFALLGSQDPQAADKLVEAHFPLQRVAAKLPADARVLFHEERLQLGLARVTIHDHKDRQGAIDYAPLATPAAVRDLFARLGVTHVWWRMSPLNLSDLGDDVVFYHFANTVLRDRVQVDGAYLAPLPASAPATSGLPIRVVSCTDELLTPVELNRQMPRLNQAQCEARGDLDLARLVEGVDAAVVDTQVYAGEPPPGFDHLITRDRFRVWSRRPR